MLKLEWKKFYSKITTKLILIVLLLGAAVLGFMTVNSVRYMDTDGKTLDGIGKIAAGRKLAADKNRWKGTLTPERIAETAESYYELNQQYQGEVPESEWGKTVQSYYDILEFASRMCATDLDTALASMERLAENDLTHIYDIYADNQQRMAEEYGKTPEQKHFLKELYKKMKFPVTYKASDSWEITAERIVACIVVLVIVIGFMTAGIFNEEFQNNAEMVYFTSKYGRTKAVKSKIAVGMIAATVIYWEVIGTFSLISFGIMGISGFFTPYQIQYPYSCYLITVGQYYLLVIVSGYIACLLSAAVTMFVTSKMHTVKVAVCIPFFMYIVLVVMEKNLAKITSFVYFTPNVLINIDNQLKHPHIFQIGNIVFRQIPFVVIMYAFIIVIFLPLIYRCYSRYDSAKTTRRGV